MKIKIIIAAILLALTVGMIVAPVASAQDGESECEANNFGQFLDC